MARSPYSPNPYPASSYGPTGDDYRKMMAAQAQQPQALLGTPNSYQGVAPQGPSPQAPPMIDPTQLPGAGGDPSVPGYRSDYTRTANKGSKFGYAQKYALTPEQARMEIMLAMGGEPKQASNPDGTPKYEVDPSTGRMSPGYDLSNVTYNPQHPVQQELAGIEQMKKMVADYAAGDKAQVDLSPLMALADAQKPGSHLAEAYHPHNNQATIDKILSYSDEIQKRRNDVMTGVRGQLSSLGNGGTFTNMLQTALVDKAMEGQHTPKPSTAGAPGAEWHKWEQTVQGDKSLGKSAEMLNTFAQARKMVESNNPAAMGSTRLEIVKAITGSGRITNQEYANEGGDASLWETVLQKAKKMESGQWTETNKKELISMIDDLMEAPRQSYTSHHQAHLFSAAQRPGMNVQAAEEYLKKLEGGAGVAKPQAAKVATPVDTKAAATDELKGLLKSNQDLMNELKGSK